MILNLRKISAFVFVLLLGTLVCCKKEALSPLASNGMSFSNQTHAIKFQETKFDNLIVGPIINTNHVARTQEELMDRPKMRFDVDRWPQYEIYLAYMDIRNAYANASKEQKEILIDYQYKADSIQRKYGGLGDHPTRKESMRILMGEVADAVSKLLDNAYYHHYSYYRAWYLLNIGLNANPTVREHEVLKNLLTQIKSFREKKMSSYDQKWEKSIKEPGSSLFELPYSLYSKYRALGLPINNLIDFL